MRLSVAAPSRFDPTAPSSSQAAPDHGAAADQAIEALTMKAFRAMPPAVGKGKDPVDFAPLRAHISEHVVRGEDVWSIELEPAAINRLLGRVDCGFQPQLVAPAEKGPSAQLRPSSSSDGLPAPEPLNPERDLSPIFSSQLSPQPEYSIRERKEPRLSVDEIILDDLLPALLPSQPCNQDRDAMTTMSTFLEASVPVEKRTLDPDCLVLPNGINSESEQQRLIATTIESADKFAVITSYGVRPIENGRISATTMAILKAVAERQDDEDFSFTFMYNKSTWQQNMVVGKRTNVSQNPGPRTLRAAVPDGWSELINAYNEQADEHGSTPITNLRCNVFLVAEKPESIAGSHHNKFCLNDRGFAATLGASIGNKTKSNWFDSGAMVLSQPLATSQRNYFSNTMLAHGGHVSRLQVADGQPSLQRLADATAVQQAVASEISSPVNQPADDEEDQAQIVPALAEALQRNHFSTEPSAGKVMWLQNEGSLERSRLAKPIGKALHHMFNQARAGDTLCLRNCSIGSIKDWAMAALQRGVNIKILGPVNKSDSTYYGDLGKLFAAKADAEADGQPVVPLGELEFRVFNPDPELRDLHDYDREIEDAVDHAKVYLLEGPDTTCLMTGTHNLDGQSFKRSNENMMVIEPADNALPNSLFHEIWQGCPAITADEVGILAREAGRYHFVFGAKFHESPHNGLRPWKKKSSKIPVELQRTMGIKGSRAEEPASDLD